MLVGRKRLERIDQRLEFEEFLGFSAIGVLFPFCGAVVAEEHQLFRSGLHAFLRRKPVGDAHGTQPILLEGDEFVARQDHAVERQGVVVFPRIVERGGGVHQRQVHPDVVAGGGAVELRDPFGDTVEIRDLDQRVDHLHDGVALALPVRCVLDHVGERFDALRPFIQPEK